MRTAIDVSHWNKIDWTKFRPDILMAKCTEGIGYKDQTYEKNRTEAKKRNIPFGAYHFANKNDPIKEAEYFLSQENGADFLVLDSETGQSVDWCESFLYRISKAGKPILLYAPVSSWNTKLDVPLWVARYGPNDGKIHEDYPPKIGKWDDWTMWQYTSRGSVSGVSGDVDMNLMKDTFLTSNSENMQKEFVEAVEKLLGEEYGDNLNDSEQKDAAKKLKEVKTKLDWIDQLEKTNARLLENNETLAAQIVSMKAEISDMLDAQIASANAEISVKDSVIRQYEDKAGICEQELATCRENLRIASEKANDGISVYSISGLFGEIIRRLISSK